MANRTAPLTFGGTIGGGPSTIPLGAGAASSTVGAGGGGGLAGRTAIGSSTNMTSYIRDTLYKLPPPGLGGDLTSPRTASGRPGTSGTAPGTTATTGVGSHSSKFAVLNSLQQQAQHGTNAIDPLSTPATTAPRGQPRGPGLDLGSLLAGPASSQPSNSSAAFMSSLEGEKKVATAKVPRTLSGRPRPTANGGVVAPPAPTTAPSGVNGVPLAMTKPSPRGVLPQQQPSSKPPLESGEFDVDDVVPREDNAAAILQVNSERPQIGIAPSVGNQTARNSTVVATTTTSQPPSARGRPNSAAVDPLFAAPAEQAAATPTHSSSGAGSALGPVAPGTLATLGGCAVGPEFRGMQPARVIALYEAQLSKYERREVLDYDDVYFIGPEAAKADAPVANAPNFGYDDDRGDYLVCKNDHIAYRYEVVGELGRGSFGQVLRVKDYKRNCECALKMIRNRKRFHQQAQVEIKILEHLRSRDPDDKSCTVRMLNYFNFRSHTCITFELHAMNLYELTKLNRYQPFPPALIKRFTGQLLVAVSFMWREQIVHCDLKPENILLKQENKTGIKVIDFGSSCFESERVYSYIQSRFYRAPEIMLGLPYGRPIDLWSVGCIICEMAIGFPIFPGENEHEQLLCIMEVLGTPPSRFVDKSPRKAKFFDGNGQPRLVPNSRNKVRRPSTKDLASVLRTEDASFVDFILKFLKWDPAERITPNEAMRHPYIAECFHQDTIPPGPATAGSSAPSASSSQPNAATNASSSFSQSQTMKTVASSRPGSSAPVAVEQQPSAPIGSSIVAHHQRHMSANTRDVQAPTTGAPSTLTATQPSSARVPRQPGLHQMGSLTGLVVSSAASSGGSQTARVGGAALPSIGSQPVPPTNLVPTSARRPRPQQTANRMQFNQGEMFL